MTLIHEIAHLVAFEKFGRNIKPHGNEWKYTFQRLMVPFIRPEIFPGQILPLLARHFKNIDALRAASTEQLLQINGVGETLVISLQDYFRDSENLLLIQRLKEKGLRFEVEESTVVLQSNKLEGMKILASGRLNHFKRDEIIDFIEANGGQYLKAVSKGLDFIIEGEEMGPSKKEKAEKLGIKLISEEEFQAVRNQFENQIVSSNSTVAGIAENLAQNKMYFGNTELINKQMEIYMSITREDIQRVAKKYLTQDNRIILHYLPKAN